jgi:lysophospholipase
MREALIELREQLPALTPGAEPRGLWREFCVDYGLAPEQHLPGVRHRAGRVDSGNFELVGHAWEQPGASHNLLLVHGYLDHSGLFGKLVEYGLGQNYNVLLFDLPGHGLSTGESSRIADFSLYGEAIADVMAAAGMPTLPWLVMAQSMGAAALIEYARAREWPFRGAVLLAPLIRPAGWARVCTAYLLVHRFLESVPRDFANNSSDAAFLAFVRSDPLQSRRIPVAWVGALRRWLQTLPDEDLGVGPAMIVQGDADRTVDWRYNLPVVLRLFPASRVEYLSGAGHQLANESCELRRRYLEKVSEYFASLA